MHAIGPISDVVSRITRLSLPNDKHPILALAKTDQQRAESKKAKSKKEIGDERDDCESDDSDALQGSNERRLALISRKKWSREAYTKPLAAAGLSSSALASRQVNLSQSDRHLADSELSREKRLRHQASRGVIALFNAVRQHQSSVKDQLTGAGDGSVVLETQKEKVLTQMSKADFLDRLAAGLPGGKRSASEGVESKKKKRKQT